MSRDKTKEILKVADNAAITIEAAVKIALTQIAALERSVTGAEINADARAARVAAMQDLEAGIDRAYSNVCTEINKLNGGD